MRSARRESVELPDGREVIKFRSLVMGGKVDNARSAAAHSALAAAQRIPYRASLLSRSAIAVHHGPHWPFRELTVSLKKFE